MRTAVGGLGGLGAVGARGRRAGTHPGRGASRRAGRPRGPTRGGWGGREFNLKGEGRCLEDPDGPTEEFQKQKRRQKKDNVP